MKTYIELDVWVEGRRLVSQVYELTKSFPREEVYGLTSQLRRCAVSVPSNIAEGCGRQTPKETIHFLYISRGSLYELETQMFLAFDQQYIRKEGLQQILTQIETTKKLLNGFINYYKKL